MSVFSGGIADPVVDVYGMSVDAPWPIHPALQ